MRDSRPLSVDISDLLRVPGARTSVRGPVVLEGLEMPMAQVRPDLDLDLALEALVDAIHITGGATGVFTFQCRRCLRQTERTERVDVDELAAYPGDERDDAYQLDGESIDLGAILRDVIVGDLPFSPVCRPGCKGLCPTCGADRNESDCGHDDRPVDVRWSALADLKQKMED